MYDTLITLHILGAVTWVGGALVIQLLYLRIAGTATPLSPFFMAVEWVGTRFFISSSLVLVLTGFGMIAEGDWDWEGWIIFGLVVWTGSFITGAFFLGPETGRIGKLADERGENDAEVISRRERVLKISRVELLFLVLVVIAMAAKPG